MISENEIKITLNSRRIIILTVFFGILIALTYTYIIGLMAFVTPSYDLPLRFDQVSSLDDSNNSASLFSKGDLVRINATVEMALSYGFFPPYTNFTGPVQYRILLSIYDLNNMPVTFREYQHTIFRGQLKNELFDYTIALDAASGTYTARLMLWSDWLPTGIILAPTAAEVTFSVS